MPDYITGTAPISPIYINNDIGTEIFYQYYIRDNRYTLYYHIIDNTQTSTIIDARTGDRIPIILNYKILNSKKNTVLEQEYITALGDSYYAKDLAFTYAKVKKPVKVILIYLNCKMESYFGQFFITGSNLSDSDFLYIDENTTKIWNEYEGEISDGEYLASYSSKGGIKVISLCKI